MVVLSFTDFAMYFIFPEKEFLQKNKGFKNISWYLTEGKVRLRKARKGSLETHNNLLGWSRKGDTYMK